MGPQTSEEPKITESSLKTVLDLSFGAPTPRWDYVAGLPVSGHVLLWALQGRRGASSQLAEGLREPEDWRTDSFRSPLTLALFAPHSAS